MVKTKMGGLKLNTFYLWIRSLQKKISPIDNLREKGIHSIIIYGMAELGELMVREADENDFPVVAITDEKVIHRNNSYDNIPIIPVNDLMLDKYRHVCVVITSMNFVEEIEAKLNEMRIEKVISLIDLL